MSSHATSKIFMIGATGAQGIPVTRSLVADGKYSVRFLTRDATGARARALLELGNTSALEGTFTDETILREGFRRCDGAFINIDGFNTGEKTEMYWAIRAYEIAMEEGSDFSYTEISTTGSRRLVTTPGTVSATMTARGVSPNGSCFRISQTRSGWVRRSSHPARTLR